MFWRFASVLRFGGARGLPRYALDEARDEMASIARHTHSAELQNQCGALLDAYAEQRFRDMTIIPFWADTPVQVGCTCPVCGAHLSSDGKAAVARIVLG